MRAVAVVVAVLAAVTAARAAGDAPFYAAVAAGSWHGVVSSDGKRFAVPGDRFGSLALGPDGSMLVAPLGSRAVWIGRLGGAGRRVATPGRTSLPVFAPDGRVAYGAGASIRVVGGATLRPRLAAGARIVEVAAGRAAFAVTAETGNGRDGTLRNALYLVRGAMTKMLAAGFDAYSERPHPVFSPDGSRIAFEQGGDIWVVDLAGTKRRITRTSVATETGARWSPDGTRLGYTTGRHGVNEVYVATLDGRETRLTHTTARPGGVPQVGSTMGAWSPDGKSVAVVTYNALGVVPATGGAERIVRTFTPAASAYVGPVWWPAA